MKEKQQLQGEKTVEAIDWGVIYNRLEAARRIIERGGEPTPGEKKKILKARARELAKGTGEQEESGESIEVVEFIVAYERYGIESSYVTEVYPLKDITPLPGTPLFLAGIINVRGRIISVVDIKKFFDLPEKGLGDFNKLVILASETMELGVLADEIPGVGKIAVSQLQSAPATFTGVREEYLKGITRDRMAVIDGKKLLSDKRLIVYQEV